LRLVFVTAVDGILLGFWLFSWILIGTIYVHSLFLSFFGLRRWKPQPDHLPEKRFAVLVAAHNESLVIEPLLRDLMSQEYPRPLYDVYVIADNCSDRTVEVARSISGVRVLIKAGPNRGKGEALRFGIDRILTESESKPGASYHAFAFFDADNRVSSNFLQKMNNELCRGNRFIQGYLGTKNPYDNWVTRVIYHSYAMTNRLWQLGKRRTGLPSQCGGTGFCLESELLQDLGWPVTTTTEDLEMVCLLAQRGVFPVWSPEAVVYDEKPRSVRVAVRQRIRWMRGHFNNLFRFFLPLVRTGIRTRDVRVLDCALYLLYPLSIFAVGIQSILWLIGATVAPHLAVLHPGALSLLILAMATYYPALGIYLETRSLRELRYLPLLFVFNWTWIFACFVALFTLRNRSWYHTPHGSTLDDGIRL
jgi:cellulose synthase/poly-beta-1,6-N-acetylglucosamine synthase-like glycosyltransferase